MQTAWSAMVGAKMIEAVSWVRFAVMGHLRCAWDRVIAPDHSSTRPVLDRPRLACVAVLGVGHPGQPRRGRHRDRR
ncbi:MAG: hypothetical protein EBT47_05350 [Chloroflexi bacterium]|nr:hypothetical protein [Chloroflexota bacterium]